MVVLRRWVLVGTALLWGALRLAAASDENAFQAAKRDFSTGPLERAEAKFAEFVQTYTNSPRLTEAVLYQAEARVKLGRPDGALQLLTNRVTQAGKLTPQYLFWTGEALAQKGDYRGAADTFGKVLQGFPTAPQRLEAAVEQAVASSKLGEWPRVIELLQQPAGAFQGIIRTNATDAWAQRGWLLLSEAWLRQGPSPGNLTAAEAALQPLANLTLKPDMGWQRQWLLCRIQLGHGQTNEALLNSTNLVALAVQTRDRVCQAESYEFRARLLEGLGRIDEAIAAYTNNLAEGFPAESQGEALLQSTRLLLATNRTAEAIQTLERFVTQVSNAPAADLALLTLGGLHLRQRVAGLKAADLDALPPNSPGPTNAIARLEELVQRFPQSPYLGKGRLELGWCFYLEGRLPEARTNFMAAARLLPPSLDQATACFKLADTQYREGDPQGALTNYNRVVDACAALPEAKNALLEPALFQVVHAGLAAGKLTEATNAMGRLLALDPDGAHTAPAVLVAGEAMARSETPGRARDWLAGFAASVTNSPLLPQVKLALARTWEQEDNWTNAILQYASLMTNCPDSNTLALAEFYRAQATWRAGDSSNALSLYTNFVATYSTHTNAPVAQFWVGDYYFNQGNMSAAELAYEHLCEDSNWQSSELVNPAWMMAGRAAYQQQLWSNATNAFSHLTLNSTCPSNLWVEAMFAYADCFRHQVSKEKGDLGNASLLNQAIVRFDRIIHDYPGSPQALLALGAKAESWVQLAQYSGENANYTNALSAYEFIATNRACDVALRSMAKVGLAAALKWQADQKTGAEQTALLKLALDHCLDVAHGAILLDNEKANPYWTLMAGEKAIGLAEALQEWPEAIKVCDELVELFPPLRARYLEKKRTLEARQGAAGDKS